MELTLERAPAVSMLRLALARKSGLSPGETIPSLCLRLPGVSVGGYTDFARLCGFEGGQVAPPTWPAILAAPLHKALLLRPEFPLPVLGMVHTANRIEQHGPWDGEDRVDISVSVEGHREARLGVEFDLITTLTDGADLLWRETKTLLVRTRQAQREGRSAVSTPAPRWTPDQSAEWSLGADLGRRYGAVSGDRNPIHMYAWTARPFGFRRAIVQGMWTLSRVLAQLSGSLAEGPVVAECQFRRPILLPARVLFEAVAERDAVRWRVASADGSRDHVLGQVTRL